MHLFLQKLTLHTNNKTPIFRYLFTSEFFFYLYRNTHVLCISFFVAPYTPTQTTEHLFPGTWYLTDIDNKHRRKYQRKPTASVLNGHDNLEITGVIPVCNNLYIVKPAHAVTSIEQSPVLKGDFFLVLSQKISYELNLFLQVICLIRPPFICPKRDLLIQVGLHLFYSI